MVYHYGNKGRQSEHGIAAMAKWQLSTHKQREENFFEHIVHIQSKKKKKKGEQKQREEEFQREEENKERGASRGKVYALSSCAKRFMH